ncbi:hypothetical protein [Sporosarcina sp. P33]|uniref:hypothetical protein n=1 Tax=Sporosarcina sp. P33 TaxID=1930764 RepID=UPI0009C01164|nr:hypothetical protein [Sporosarcina sp. P33]ARD48293.1 hypothetical protein SporoP33_08660 [Sporosarcina sp. P33]
MNSKHLFLMGSIALPLTFLLAYDFFPNFNQTLYIPKPLLIGLMLVILLVGFFITRIQKMIPRGLVSGGKLQLLLIS